MALVNHADELNTENFVKVYKLMSTTYQKIKSDKALKEELAGMTPIDVETLKAKMSSVDAINKAVRLKIKKNELLKEGDAVVSAARILTDKIEAGDAAKAKAFKAAKFPVEGLGCDDNGVTFNGVPFCQCAASERLRISIAVAMSKNPKLKILRVADASLLDGESFAILQEMAKDKGYQAWIERVSDGDGIGIVIEDGAIVGAETPEPKKRTKKVVAPSNTPAAAEETVTQAMDALLDTVDGLVKSEEEEL